MVVRRIPGTLSTGCNCLRNINDSGRRPQRIRLHSEMQRAIDIMTMAIEKHRDDVFMYYENHGYAYQALGDKEKAQADFKEMGRLQAVK